MILVVYLFVRALAYLFLITFVGMVVLCWIGVCLVASVVGGISRPRRREEVVPQARFSDRR